jgi:hypothetical protein
MISDFWVSGKRMSTLFHVGITEAMVDSANSTVHLLNCTEHLIAEK